MPSVTIYGYPAPKGSMKCIARGGRHQLVEAVPKGKGPERKAWRAKLADAGRALADDNGGPYTGPVMIRAVFTLQRAASVPLLVRWWPWRKGSADVDKLLRMCLDGLADGGCFGDDVQVVIATGAKVYPDTPLSGTGIPTGSRLGEPGAHITIVRVEDVPETPTLEGL